MVVRLVIMRECCDEDFWLFGDFRVSRIGVSKELEGEKGHIDRQRLVLFHLYCYAFDASGLTTAPLFSFIS